MNNCPFCAIIAGRVSSYRILEDEHTVAFLDIAPASPGHTLVVPREHAADMWTISETAHAHVARTVHQVATLLKTALAPDGLNITHATGKAAWQDVFHFHTHVIPRWQGDNLKPMWNSQQAPNHKLEQTLKLITTAR